MENGSDLLRQAQSQAGLIEFGETSFREGSKYWLRRLIATRLLRRPGAPR